MGTLNRTRERRTGARIALALCAGLALLASAPATSTSFVPFELPVMVEEHPGLVRINVALPPGVSPDSIEVQVDGRDLVVLGSRHGLPVRSRPMRLSHPMIARGAQVDFESDGSLTVTLHADTGGGS